MLFAVLPYQVTGVTGSVSQSGQTVKINLAVQISQGKAGRHIMNVKVTDPTGRRRPEYDMDVIAEHGKADYSFKLALNDPTGQWTIDLEDVATGTAANTTIQIIKPQLAMK